MAVQFHELPLSVFPKESRQYIARLNRELRDLFALEGMLKNPTSTNRSDGSVVRRSEFQVDISRITPSVASVVSGVSTVVGTPNLTLSTSNLVGTTTTAIATDSTIAVFGTSSPVALGAVATGSQAKAARIDHVHPFSETLATAADRTKAITLTQGGEGAVITCGSTWTGTKLDFFPPGATVPIQFNSIGNIGACGVSALINTGLNFSFTPTGGTASTLNGINGTVINYGTGSAVGVNAAASTLPAATLNTSDISALVATATSSGTSASGEIIGCKSIPLTTGNNKTITNISGFKSIPNNFVGTGCTYTNFSHFWAVPAATILSAPVTQRGFYCGAIKHGATRVGFDCDAISTGTPTSSYGVRVGTHSVGTTRRSVLGGNSLETDYNFIAGVTGMGLVVKDANDGNYYLIGTSAGVIGVSSLGTTKPAL